MAFFTVWCQYNILVHFWFYYTPSMQHMTFIRNFGTKIAASAQCSSLEMNAEKRKDTVCMNKTNLGKLVEIKLPKTSRLEQNLPHLAMMKDLYNRELFPHECFRNSFTKQ